MTDNKISQGKSDEATKNNGKIEFHDDRKEWAKLRNEAIKQTKEFCEGCEATEGSLCVYTDASRKPTSSEWAVGVFMIFTDENIRHEERHSHKGDVPAADINVAELYGIGYGLLEASRYITGTPKKVSKVWIFSDSLEAVKEFKKGWENFRNPNISIATGKESFRPRKQYEEPLQRVIRAAQAQEFQGKQIYCFWVPRQLRGIVVADKLARLKLLPEPRG